MTLLGVAILTLLGLMAGVYAIAVLEGALGRRRPLYPTLSAPLARARSQLRQETLMPRGADALLFRTAPVIAFSAPALAALVIPLAPGIIAFDPSIGLFYLIAVLGPFIIAMMNAGWSSNSKTALFGVFRAAAHLISYEVPLGFAVIGPAMAAESLSTTRIVLGQAGLWYAVWQPLGFAIYLVAALMLAMRRPFDLPQADSELGGGVLAEYSGARLLVFEVALHAMLLLLAALGVVAFLGGWHGPLLPPAVWFVLKTAVVATGMVWLGRHMPRLRHDQMLALAWKALLPASLLNIMVVGILMLIQE